MAQLSFEDAIKSTKEPAKNENVKYFSLKNDGDEAVVRFMDESTSDFSIYSVHEVTAISKNGKEFKRKVNCLRTPHDPIDNCPLCKNGDKLMSRFFVRVLQYTKDGNGNIVAEPKIWEKAGTFATELRTYLNTYGTLNGYVCRIVRHGAPGDTGTTYQIIPNLPNQIYPESEYVNNKSLFDGYNVLGTAIMNRNKSDLEYYVEHHEFPVRNNTTQGAEYAVKKEPARSEDVDTHKTDTDYSNIKKTYSDDDLPF